MYGIDLNCAGYERKSNQNLTLYNLLFCILSYGNYSSLHKLIKVIKLGFSFKIHVLWEYKMYICT